MHRFAATVARPIDGVVVQCDALPVGAEPDVELDPARAEFACHAHPGERVLGSRGGRAAMTDDGRQVESRRAGPPAHTGLVRVAWRAAIVVKTPLSVPRVADC